MPRPPLLLFAGLLVLGAARAQDASVERGRELFAAECSRCHIPIEMDRRLRADWLGRTGAELLARIRGTMPAETPGSLSGREYRDLTAYILSAGGVPVGEGVADLGGVLISPADPERDRGAEEETPWLHYNGDVRATRYAPLAQIDAGNAGELEVAWTFDTGPFGPSPEVYNVSTPLMAGGRLYATAGATRNVVALDPATGQLLWMWRPEEGERFETAPRKGSGKGLAYHRDGAREAVFTVTPGYFLAALNARTGDPVETFGAGGYVDLREGLRLGPGRDDVDIGLSFPPLVVEDVVVVGAAHEVGMRPVSASNVKGDVRGFDARSGELLWTFRTIPGPGEPGHETWLDGSAGYTGNAGVWAPMSADPERGHVYLPVESATGDRYGADRLGDNLFSSSTVALDYRTGAMRWHFQTTHHDIWDWDTPAAPIAVTLPDGRDAVVQTLKQSHLFVFDADGGEPLFPVEERPVPASDAPEEVAAATQPYPLLPPPYDRQGFQEDDLVDFTPEIRARALEIASRYRFSELYTPPSQYRHPVDGTLGTLHLPSSTGGSNWEGAAWDPETGVLYVPSRTATSVLALVNDPDASSVRFIQGGERPPTVDGIPLVKPPYGRITAIDLTTGRHLWQVVNGDTPDAIRDHPLLAGVELPPTGKPTRAGLVLTKTLLFAGEGPRGDPVLRAIDKATGETVAEVALPATATGAPMTYMHRGRQYIVTPASDFRNSARFVALALP